MTSKSFYLDITTKKTYADDELIIDTSTSPSAVDEDTTLPATESKTASSDRTFTTTEGSNSSSYAADVRVVTEAELNNPNFRCLPDEVFKVDCNTCWCHKNGKEPKNCTRIACDPKNYAPLADEQRIIR